MEILILSIAQGKIVWFLNPYYNIPMVPTISNQKYMRYGKTYEAELLTGHPFPKRCMNKKIQQ